MKKIISLLIGISIIIGCASTSKSFNNLSLTESKEQSIGLYMTEKYHSLVLSVIQQIEHIPHAYLYPPYAGLEDEKYRYSGIVIYTPDTEYKYEEYFKLFFDNKDRSAVNLEIENSDYILREVQIDKYHYLVIGLKDIREFEELVYSHPELEEAIRKNIRIALGYSSSMRDEQNHLSERSENNEDESQAKEPANKVERVERKPVEVPLLVSLSASQSNVYDDLSISLRSSDIGVYSMEPTALAEGRLDIKAGKKIDLYENDRIDNVTFSSGKKFSLMQDFSFKTNSPINFISFNIGYGSIKYKSEGTGFKASNDYLPNGSLECNTVYFVDERALQETYYITRTEWGGSKDNSGMVFDREIPPNIKTLMKSISQTLGGGGALFIPFSPILPEWDAGGYEIEISLDFDGFFKSKGILNDNNAGTPFDFGVTFNKIDEDKIDLNLPPDKWYTHPWKNEVAFTNEDISVTNPETNQSIDLISISNSWTKVGNNGGYNLNMTFTDNTGGEIEKVYANVIILNEGSTEDNGSTFNGIANFSNNIAVIKKENNSPRRPRGGYKVLEYWIYFKNGYVISTVPRFFELPE